MSNISRANCDFIEKNYSTMTVDELCVSTGLERQMVEDYIVVYKNLLESQGVFVEDSFSFSIIVDTKGQMRYRISYSDDKVVEKLSPQIAKMFFKLNNGVFKETMVYYLIKYSQAFNNAPAILDIIKNWNDLAVEENPIVSPIDIFKDIKDTDEPEDATPGTQN